MIAFILDLNLLTIFYTSLESWPLFVLVQTDSIQTLKPIIFIVVQSMVTSVFRKNNLRARIVIIIQQTLTHMRDGNEDRSSNNHMMASNPISFRMVARRAYLMCSRVVCVFLFAFFFFSLAASRRLWSSTWLWLG